MRFSPSHILVPVAVHTDDDRRLAKYAATSAGDIAKAMGGRVSLYYAGPDVHELMTPYPGLPSASVEVMHKVLRERLNFVQAQLDHLQQELAEAGYAVEVILDEAHADTVPNAIARAVREYEVDLVVIPSHGRKGVGRFLLGSVAERVAHIVAAPVLLLRLPEGCC